jgi:hypothetical protein
MFCSSFWKQHFLSSSLLMRVLLKWCALKRVLSPWMLFLAVKNPCRVSVSRNTSTCNMSQDDDSIEYQDTGEVLEREVAWMERWAGTRHGWKVGASPSYCQPYWIFYVLDSLFIPPIQARINPSAPKLFSVRMASNRVCKKWVLNCPNRQLAV